MGAAELELFLTNLAVEGNVSASTQNQALNAIVFLYRDVLDIELGRLDAVRARRPKRLPVVLAPEEVAKVLALVEGADGVFALMARLLLWLRVKAHGVLPTARQRYRSRPGSDHGKARERGEGSGRDVA